MIKAEVDSSSSCHLYMRHPVVDSFESKKFTIEDEKPFSYLHHSHLNEIVEKPNATYVIEQLNSVAPKQLSRFSPTQIKYEMSSQIHPSMPLPQHYTGSSQLESPIIKYCGSSNNNHIIENLRIKDNLSPPFSNSTNVSPMENSRIQGHLNKGHIIIGSINALSNKSAQQIDQPPTPDTTKKSSGGRRAEKPPLSYINMIAMAIKESQNKRCTLNEIYSFLKKR